MKTYEWLGYSYEIPDDAEYEDAFDQSSKYYNDEWAKQARVDFDMEMMMD